MTSTEPTGMTGQPIGARGAPSAHFPPTGSPAETAGRSAARLRRTGAIALAVLVAGALLTSMVVRQADRSMRATLEQESRLVAEGISLERVASLTGSTTDVATPEYQRMKAFLQAVKQSNEQYRFAYLLGRADDRGLFIFVDNEPPDSEDYSPPGDLYVEAAPGMHDAFDTRTAAVVGPYTDRWGRWVSALAPVMEQRNGELLAVLGLDVSAARWSSDLARAAIPPVLLTAALLCALLVGTALLSRRAHAAWWDRGPLRHTEQGIAISAGIAITLFGAWLAYHQESLAGDAVFAQLAASTTSHVQENLRDLRDTELEGLGSHFEGSEYVTRDEYHAYAAHLERSALVQSWRWTPAVSATDKDMFEQQVAAEGYPGFHIWQTDETGARVPASGRDWYYPVLYATPRDDDAAYVGCDLGANQPVREVLEEAWRTGRPTATGALISHQSQVESPVIAVVRPVFEIAQPGVLRGFVLAMVPADALLRNSGADDTVLMSASLLSSDGASELLAFSGPDGESPPGRPALSRPIAAFGRVLVIGAYPGDGFVGSQPARAALLAAFVGLLLTIAFALVLHMVLRRHAELERAVAERSASLRESEQKYRELFEQSRDAIAIVATDGTLLDANPAYWRLLGIPPEEPRRINVRSHYKDAAIRDAFVQRMEREGEVIDDEQQLIRPDGTAIDCLRTSVARRDADGRIVAYQTVLRDVTARKRDETALRESEERLRSLTAYLEQVREQERTGIARELHDQVGQSLTALRLDLASLANLPLDGKDIPVEKLTELVRLVDQTSDDVRRISSELRPGMLDDVGLVAAIEWQLDQFRRRTGTVNTLTTHLNTEPDRATSTALYRVFQELLTNVARHANARTVQVRFEQRDGQYILSVEDDGRGIDESQVESPSSLGLIGIRERLRPLDGRLSLHGRPGRGTTAQVTVPAR